MKKFYMSLVALLCGATAMAQNVLYVENIKVDAGTTEVEVPVCMKNDKEITAASFLFLLPDGVTIKTNKKGNPIATVDEDRMEDHLVAFTPQTDADGNPTGQQMISVYSMSSATFYENDGPIVVIPVVVPGDDATYEVTLGNISIATPDGVSVSDVEEVTFTIQVGEGTGINSINAIDSKAPIYNVAGQRVSNAQKGVYIQNGKKVAVK